MPQNFCTKIENSGRSEALMILVLCMEKNPAVLCQCRFKKKREGMSEKYGLVKIKQL